MTTEQLGEVRQEFKPGLENLVAGMILGLLLIGGGCAAVYFPINAAPRPNGLSNCLTRVSSWPSTASSTQNWCDH